MSVASGEQHRIVSVSLPPRLVAEVDRVAAKGGGSARSRIVRDALERYLAEEAARGGDDRPVAVVVSACFGRREEKRVADAKHAHAGLLKGMLHSHLEGEDCLEVYIVKGKAREVDAFLQDLGSIRGIHVVRAMAVPEHR